MGKSMNQRSTAKEEMFARSRLSCGEGFTLFAAANEGHTPVPNVCVERLAGVN